MSLLAHVLSELSSEKLPSTIDSNYLGQEVFALLAKEEFYFASIPGAVGKSSICVLILISLSQVGG